ncbi:MAG: HAMP domain-containing histidine kinase [Proteobacteria bacterium]|nr:HAMP domain-containing histidine kinase [Pseudomonadota bacterium]
MKFRKPKLGLGVRLALISVLIILTILMIDGVSRVFVPEPDVILMEREWLADTIGDTQALLDGAPPEARPKLLADLPSRNILAFSLDDAPNVRWHHGASDSDIQVAALRDALRQRLRPNTEFIVAVKDFGGNFDYALTSIAVVTTKLPVRATSSTGTDNDTLLVTPNLDIHLRLADGSWLTASQSSDDSVGLRLVRNFAAPVFSILFILLISYWGAHRLLRPLRQLSVAAEKMGRERNVTLIPEMKIPEYKAIADSFNDMQLRLKRFVDDRTQMLAAISHDLGSPLTRLRLLAEDLDDPRQRDQVLSDVAEMQMMIQSSLLFARDDAQQESYVTVDIASLVISLCDNASDAGQAAIYRGADHASLRCRPTAIRRAVNNLIDNGCKYGGRVTVTLHDDADALVIAIADIGPGIAPSDIETAFKPFQRLETSRNRATGGTGLGLTIARDIVHGHGGSLTLRNNEGAPGLTATIRLPKPGR